MVADGYASVTSRRVATEAGVTAALIHYHFGTIDDLFVAVLERRAEESLVRQRAQLAASPKPLHLLWSILSHERGTAVTLELVAASRHHKQLEALLSNYSEQFRALYIELLGDRLGGNEVGGVAVPADAALALLNAVASNVTLERSIGVETGHAGALEAVERWLDIVEP